MNTAFWRELPGLAGGIDKDGRRADELLRSGFGSVEFGTVTPYPVPDHNPGVAALAARLSMLDRRGCSARIGVSLGAGVDAAPRALADEWLAGMHAIWRVADYLCFNLSARAYQPLLEARHVGLLIDAIGAVVRERACLAGRTGRRVALALKLPLAAEGEHWPDVLTTIARLELDALIAVLPEAGERLAALGGVASLHRGRTLLVAVGGIHTAEDVRAALAAGADGIQVHGAFIERGVDCLPALLAGMSAFSEARREAP